MAAEQSSTECQTQLHSPQLQSSTSLALMPEGRVGVMSSDLLPPPLPVHDFQFIISAITPELW